MRRVALLPVAPGLVTSWHFYNFLWLLGQLEYETSLTMREQAELLYFTFARVTSRRSGIGLVSSTRKFFKTLSKRSQELIKNFVQVATVRARGTT